VNQGTLSLSLHTHTHTHTHTYIKRPREKLFVRRPLYLIIAAIVNQGTLSLSLYTHTHTYIKRPQEKLFVRRPLYLIIINFKRHFIHKYKILGVYMLITIKKKVEKTPLMKWHDLSDYMAVSCCGCLLFSI